MEKVLLINDLSCVGKCSLTVSIPIISTYGIETVPLPTCILSNQTYFKDYLISDCSKEIESFIKLWTKQNIKFNTVYTGFFNNYKQIDYICDYLKDKNVKLFVDPVLGDNGNRFKCFDDNHQKSLKKLVDMADYISPNLTEACLLTDSNINEDPLEIIKKFKNKKVVITSIHKDDKIGYLVKDDDEIFHILNNKVKDELHGTGDVFASFLCAKMIQTNNFSESVIHAAKKTNDCITATLKEKGHSIYGLNFEQVI